MSEVLSYFLKEKILVKHEDAGYYKLNIPKKWFYLFTGGATRIPLFNEVVIFSRMIFHQIFGITCNKVLLSKNESAFYFKFSVPGESTSTVKNISCRISEDTEFIASITIPLFMIENFPRSSLCESCFREITNESFEIKDFKNEGIYNMLRCLCF